MTETSPLCNGVFEPQMENPFSNGSNFLSQDGRVYHLSYKPDLKRITTFTFKPLTFLTPLLTGL